MSAAGAAMSRWVSRRVSSDIRRSWHGYARRMGAETGRITTDIPARLDRLPWARWHWMVVIGLGTVWILDGLEVTIVGSMSEALKPTDTGLGLSSFDIGLAGRRLRRRRVRRRAPLRAADRPVRPQEALPDHPGRLHRGHRADRLLDDAAVVLLRRFLTGIGIGGEYAAINSAIDELIPAKYRGRVDVAINGSFWIGAAAGSLLTIPLLDPNIVDPAWGWRLAFGLGAVLAVGILIVRRHVPESPRWLFIHGREDEGEEIVRASSTRSRRRAARRSTPSTRRSRSASARRSASSRSPAPSSRSTRGAPIVCFSLFVGQAFLYNAFFFTYGDTLTTFLGREADRLVPRDLRAQQLRRRAPAQQALRHHRAGSG